MASLKYYDKTTKEWKVVGYPDSSNLFIDESLTHQGQAADAKAVGEALSKKQPIGSYLTEVPEDYATKEYVQEKIAEAQLEGEDIDLSLYALKTDIPDQLSDLQEDDTHKFVAKAEKEAWNAKSNFSGAYSDLTGKPTLGTMASKNSITKSDLDSSVQSSLDKADSALQQSDISNLATQGYVTEQISKIPIPDVSGQIGTHNAATDAHNDIRKSIKNLEDNKLSTTELTTAINNALDQAKQSGEFDGDNGISATHSWNGTILSITSASGTSSANLKGEKGDKGDTGATGPAGKNGSDGVSPTVSVSKSGKVTTISITDKNGTKTATINDGSDGADGEDAETIPDYVRTEAEAVARIVNQHQSNDSIVIPVLTDAHCGYYTDKTNAATKLAGQLLYQIGKRAPFDCIANCGDAANGAWDTTREMTYEQYEDYTELTAEAHRGVPAVWVPGNHDDAPYMATADRATQTDMFALIGRKNRLSGSVCPNGCCYGYLDLENRKLRVIYLDTDDKRSWGTVQVGSGGTAPAYLNAHNVGGVQLRWLAETALDFGGKANPAEWSIVVVSHVALDVSGTITDAVSGASYAHSTANAATLLNAYRLGKSGSIDHNGVTVNYDFSAVESRAVVICAVHGHNHKFCSETLDGGIVSIGCPNAMNGRERVSDDGNTYAKTAGTADGTSFCIITIDRENCMIYADCVGAGYDREFEYTTEVVSYTNQLPISTDASGNIYNGKGWKENTYLSGGNDGTKAGTFATGFIPVAPAVNEFGTAFFYLKNVGMTNNQDGHRLCIYKADKTHINTYKTTIQGSPFKEYGSDGNISVITLPANVISTGVAYIRLCCGYLGEDSIITANEPIE